MSNIVFALTIIGILLFIAYYFGQDDNTLKINYKKETYIYTGSDFDDLNASKATRDQISKYTKKGGALPKNIKYNWLYGPKPAKNAIDGVYPFNDQYWNQPNNI